jgi:two-component system, OmpR family, response regulator TctD
VVIRKHSNSEKNVRILLVQDDPDLARWLTDALSDIGISVEWTNDGLIALKVLDLEEFDAVILDLELPGKSGYGILSHLQSTGNAVPVMVLTDLDSLSERVACLNAGADDFLPKPFALAELQARLRAVIRRSQRADYMVLACGSLTYNVADEQFSINGTPLKLPTREYALLLALIRRKGRYLTKQALFDRIFRQHEIANLEAIEVIIHRLRKRLAGTRVKILSARGFGYRLEQSDGDEF